MTITLELNDELRTSLEEVIGNREVAGHVLEVLEIHSIEPMPLLTVAELTPGLTPADHMRLVEEARQPGRTISVEELKAAINAKYGHVLDEGGPAA